MKAAAPIPELDEIDAFEAEFAAYLDQIAALEGSDRHQALVGFARSNLFSAAGMLMLAPYGDIHREAWRALKHEMDAETPGRQWAIADRARGQRAAARALQLPAEHSSFFVTFPFRLVYTAEDEPWIAGAVGCPRIFTADAYAHLDIADVILWNPSSGETRLLGEASGQSAIVLPSNVDERLTIYADTRAFFRDWAAARGRWLIRREAFKLHGEMPEPRDGGLPGALVIGDIRKVRLPSDVSVLEAGPGVDPVQLRKQLLRQARLPQVKVSGGADGRG